MYAIFGNDAPEEISSELDKLMKEGSEARMTERSANTLRNTVKIGLVLQLRMESGVSAKIRPMKKALDKSKQPANLKVWRCPVQQWKLLDS